MAAPLPSPKPFASGKGSRKPGNMTHFFASRFQVWGRWAIAVFLGGLLVVLLLVYLLVQWVTYSYWVGQNAQSTSVTLTQDIGHGGMSSVTVLFHDHTLVVVDVDNNDPGRVSVVRANEEIAIPDGSAVVNASLQPLIQPGRLDLVIVIRGGLAYHTEFTTFLVNNIDQLKQNPQAPGFREPSVDELRQALQKLGSA